MMAPVMFGRISAAVLSVALTAAPVPAAAQPTAAPAEDEAAKLKRAEELFINGKQLFKEGSYEAAILAFTESYELSKLPDLLYNIGNAYERLGEFANARKYLDQYRAFAPEKERETLTRRIQNIDQRLREQEEKAKADKDKQPPPVEEGPKDGPVTPPVEQPPPAEAPKKDRVFGPLAGALTGVAVVGLGVGVGLGVSAQKWKSEALGHCAEGAGGLVCDAGVDEALGKQKGLALGADISFAVAGAAAIAVIAVVAVKLSKKKKAEAASASLAPTALPRGGGLALGVRF